MFRSMRFFLADSLKAVEYRFGSLRSVLAGSGYSIGGYDAVPNSERPVQPVFSNDDELCLKMGFGL